MAVAQLEQREQPGDALDGARRGAETAKLRRTLRRGDAFLFLVSSVVVLDTLGAVATAGAQAFTWLALLALGFLVPAALVTAELGSAFPAEGGHYVWTRLAFGRGVAAVNSLLYWVAEPIWLGGSLTITAVTVVDEFLMPLHGPARVAFALAFVWLAIAAATVPLALGKWVPASGAIARIALLGGFSATVGVYAVERGVHGFAASEFAPGFGALMVSLPVLFFNYVGFDLPSTASEEMCDPQRDVPAALGRAAAAVVVLYAVPVLAILLVLPQGAISSLGGFVDAIRTVFTVYGGHVGADGQPVLSGAGAVLGAICAAGFVWALLTSGATWIMGASRSQAIACLDGAGPASLGRFSRRLGTPLRMNVLSGLVATATCLGAFALSHGDAGRYFSAALALAISTTAVAYVAIFPTVVRLRRSHPHVPRPFRIPGGSPGAWLCAVLATGATALACASLLWPGLGTPSPDAALPAGFAGDRLGYEVSQAVPLALLLLAGLAFHRAGRRTLRGCD
jgi:amino acid transporter